MRAAFLGTPAAAVPALAALAGVAEIDVVVTQPDAARGRSGALVPPPIKVAAAEWGYRVAQPETHGDLLTVMTEAAVDVAVVVAYGRILRPETLAAVPMGYVNVHFSLLPRWRGAAPVERAILAGDATTGVSLMLLDEGMDTGPVLAVIESAIGDTESGGSLTARLAHDGAVMLADVLPDYTRGRVKPAPQMASGATHAPRLTTAEAQITTEMSVADADRMVRAFAPRPGAWAIVDGTRTKLWKTMPSDTDVRDGRIEVVDDVPHIGLADGALEVTLLQPAGKRPMTGAAWARGRREPSAQLTDT